MRLDKALGWAGLTRSEAKKAVREGRVLAGGVPATDPGMDVSGARITLDGVPVAPPGETHLMVHKPAGVVTATEDGRFETVLDLVPEGLRRRGLGPVGRLDRDVTGLVILTTDGQLAHRLISPRHDAEKTYVAAVEGRLEEEHAAAFARGIRLSDFTAKPAGMRILSAGEDASEAEITLTEGKFHQVKRMFAAVGHPVTALKRVRVAGVELDPELPPGGVRPLTAEEISTLYAAAHMEQEDA